MLGVPALLPVGHPSLDRLPGKASVVAPEPGARAGSAPVSPCRRSEKGIPHRVPLSSLKAAQRVAGRTAGSTQGEFGAVSHPRVPTVPGEHGGGNKSEPLVLSPLCHQPGCETSENSLDLSEPQFPGLHNRVTEGVGRAPRSQAASHSACRPVPCQALHGFLGVDTPLPPPGAVTRLCQGCGRLHGQGAGNGAFKSLWLPGFICPLGPC